MRYLMTILIFLLTGCMSAPKFISNKQDNTKISKISFEDLDVDKNGTIDKSEFNNVIGEIDTKSPALGLFLILSMVVISTGACSFMLRQKRFSVNK